MKGEKQNMNKFITKLAKLFLGISMAAGVGVAVLNKPIAEVKAGDVEFVAGTDTSSTTTLEKNGITVTTTSGTFSRTDNYRIYANNSMTVSVSSGNITAMAFAITQNNFTANIGTWDGTNKTWSGEATSVILSASGGQVRITSFTVTTSGGSGGTTYTVTYNANGGTGTMTDSNSPYSSGATVTVLTNTFTNSGYTFDHWNTAANDGGTDYDAGDKFSISANTILYAQWVAESSADITGNVTIAYSDTSTTTNMSGNNDAASLGVSATDWSVKGYKNQASNLPGLNKAKEIRLYGNANGGNYICVNTLVTNRTIVKIDLSYGANTNFKVYAGDNTTSGTAITGSSGTYTFGSGTTGFTIINTNSGTTQVIIYSIKVYYYDPPVETYDVSFVVNTAGYGTLSSSSIADVPAGSSISVSTNTVTINGTTVTATPTANTAQYTYSFVNWTGTASTVEDDMTITANFNRATNQYGVSGTIQHGSLSNTPTLNYGSALSINIVPENENYTYPESVSVTMGGSAYAGYNYNPSTGAFSISSITGAVVITASCSPLVQPFDVTYDENGGSSVSDEQVIPGGNPSFPSSTLSGYVFKGWQEKGGDGTLYTSANATDYAVTKDVEFVAVWAIKYTVTFDSDGGSESPSDLSIETGKTFIFPSAGNKANHTFAGWKSANDENSYSVGATSPAVTAPISYTAQWTENAHATIIYKAGEGTGTDITIKEYTLGSYTLAAYPGTFAAPSGKAFSKWSDGSNEYAAGASYTIAANTTYVFTATYLSAPDVLNYTWAGISGTSYSDWNNKSGSSSQAIYAGNSAGGNNSIQIRTNQPSGIWTTTSGGIFAGISVTWNSNTAASNRSLGIYGKNSSYSSADLDSSTASVKGTKICTVNRDGTITLEGSDYGSFEYIGIKAVGGACYLDEIDIYWGAASTTPTAELDTDSVTLYTNNSSGVNAHVTIKNCEDALIEWSTESDNITLENNDEDTVTIKPAANSVTGDETVNLYVTGTDLEYEAELTVHVIEPQKGETSDNPFDVSDVISHIDDAIDEDPSTSGDNGNTYYITGIVSAIIDEYSSQYHNITFDISDDGTTTSNQFRAYRIGGSEASSISVGDVVVISGLLTKYTPVSGDPIYETKQGGTIISRTNSWAYDHIELTTEEGYDNYYYQNTSFSTDGLVVLYWEYNSTTDDYRSTNVTSLASFNDDLTTTGTKSLVATYDGHDSNSLTYHVIEKPSYDITFSTTDTKINDSVITSNGWTITTVGTTSFTPAPSYCQIGSGSNPATSITFEKTLSGVFTLKELLIDVGGFQNSAGTVTLQVGETVIGSGSISGTTDVSVLNTQYGRGSGESTTITINITNISRGIKVYGIAYTAKTDAEMVTDFVSDYMHMSHTTNDGSCKSEGWYNEAKTGYAKLFDEQKSLFNTDSAYADAKERLIAWAVANNETFDPSDYSFSKNNGARFLLETVIGKNTNTVAIIVIISMVSVTAIGGYFFLRKRKENN